MKIFSFLSSFFLFFFFANCSSVKKEPIVDYNINADNNYKYFNLESTQNQQTIVLIDKKEVSMTTLKEYMKQDKIKDLNIIKDSMEIKKLNYPTKKIKAIIIASKK